MYTVEVLNSFTPPTETYPISRRNNSKGGVLKAFKSYNFPTDLFTFELEKGTSLIEPNRGL